MWEAVGSAGIFVPVLRHLGARRETLGLDGEVDMKGWVDRQTGRQGWLWVVSEPQS